MRKWIAALTLIALCVMPLPAVAESGFSTSDLFGLAMELWQGVSENLPEKEHVSEYLSEGSAITKELLSLTFRAAERWLDAHHPGWESELLGAWDTLRKAALDGSADAREQAKEAYGILMDWLAENGGGMSEYAISLFEAIAAETGIA